MLEKYWSSEILYSGKWLVWNSVNACYGQWGRGLGDPPPFILRNYISQVIYILERLCNPAGDMRVSERGGLGILGTTVCLIPRNLDTVRGGIERWGRRSAMSARNLDTLIFASDLLFKFQYSCQSIWDQLLRINVCFKFSYSANVGILKRKAFESFYGEQVNAYRKNYIVSKLFYPAIFFFPRSRKERIEKTSSLLEVIGNVADIYLYYCIDLILLNGEIFKGRN